MASIANARECAPEARFGQKAFSGGDPAKRQGATFVIPGTGTNSPNVLLSMTCAGFVGGVFAVGEALFGVNLKDS
jgi:hypothetical protein